jgi:PIN domain nuclease of toxin-antitoxin system
MRVVLDTCILLWLAAEPERLSQRARELPRVA